jgi:hypothetical protein
MVHLVRDRLQAAVVNEDRYIDESVLELRMAVPVQSGSKMYAGSIFGSNQRGAPEVYG